MGAADVVPGVSGGSIALITGIYERLLGAITSLNKESLRFFFTGAFGAFWKTIDGTFLLTVLAGIGLSIISLSQIIPTLLAEYPIVVWSFFSGLILISGIIILRDIKSWKVGTFLTLLTGISIALLISAIPPGEGSENLFFLFGAGAIAICAMILPGVSGSFLLIVMGQYEYVLQAVNNRDLLRIAVFGAGCLIGILSFSRLIKWLLETYFNLTLALLSGFMLGSLWKIWPWKKILSYRLSSSGEQKPFLTENIWPTAYFESTGMEPLVVQALIAFAFGIILVLGIERSAYYLKRA